MLARLWPWTDRLISLSAFFGTVCLIVQVVVILIDVVGRYFGYPLTGARDISQMAMVMVVFGGMALCDRIGGHISVDVFENYLPATLNRLSDVISPLIGAAIFFGIAWTVWESAMLSRMLNLSTNILYLPKAWFQYVVVVMSIITAIAMLLRAVEAAISGQRAPHERDAAI
jgi:TRAP-type C4-dicarboxylate transport system permease small subunit